MWAEVELVLYLEVFVGHSVWELEASGKRTGLDVHFIALRGGQRELTLASLCFMRLCDTALLHTVLELFDLGFFLRDFDDVGVAEVFGVGFLLVHELDLFLEFTTAVRDLLLKRGNDRILLRNGLLMRMDSLLHTFRVPASLH